MQGLCRGLPQKQQFLQGYDYPGNRLKAASIPELHEKPATMKKNYFEAAAHKKAAELIKDIKTCFFITQFSGKSRPMSTCNFDENGVIWFYTDINSTKVKDILNDSEVRLLYADPHTNKYLDIQGEAEVVTDRVLIAQMWNPVVKIWFPEGAEDPDLCLLKIVPFSAVYWDAEQARMVQAIKIAASLITGENLVEGKEGSLDLQN